MFWRQSSNVIASLLPSRHHSHFRDTSICQFINVLLAKAVREASDGWIIQSRYFWPLHYHGDSVNRPLLRPPSSNAVFAEMHSQDKRGSRGLKTSEGEKGEDCTHPSVCLEAVFLRGVMCRSNIILTSRNKAFSILLLAYPPSMS